MDPNQHGKQPQEDPMLPISMIKRMMKDRNVELDSDETCVITMAKICELFIEDVTMRAWTKAKQYGGSTIEVNHMVDAMVDVVAGIPIGDEKTRDSPNRDD